MRAWWWVLFTTHLVWGNPDHLKDVYSDTTTRDTDTERAPQDKPYPTIILDPKTGKTRVQRSAEGEEREKKQRRFHAWGGKRYDEEEEEEIGDRREDGKPNDDDLLKLVYFYLTLNASDPKTEESSKIVREEILKHIELSPVFLTREEKRDPEISNDFSKRSNLDSPTFLQNSFNSKLEQSAKRYPSFSSWAGKRASAFNSWGGKRDYFKDSSKVTDDTGQLVNANDNIDILNYLRANQLDPNISFHHNELPDDNSDNDQTSRTEFQGKDINLQEENHPLLKRANAFNSWGGKRFPRQNQWMLKKPLSFNSWAGKRTAAFNSWGGKRAAAFNSWGGKRAAAFNSWGGKRAAAFNSWGGKRAAAFNSWGGKRAAAFNSWGGKRSPEKNQMVHKKPVAFNSWAGKRAAAFNSWGGKRAAGFNSWGEKRAEIKWNEKPILELLAGIVNKDNHVTDVLATNGQGSMPGTNANEFINQISESDSNQKYKFQEPLETLGRTGSLEKEDSGKISSLLEKRSPLFSSWLGNKIPTVLLTNGKRRPAFSSWGGKRSEHPFPPPENPGNEDLSTQKIEEVDYEESDKTTQWDKSENERKKQEVESNKGGNGSLVITERGKRSIGNPLKHKVFTRMMLQGGWPMAFKSMTHGKDFFAWGGKRSVEAIQ